MYSGYITDLDKLGSLSVSELLKQVDQAGMDMVSSGYVDEKVLVNARLMANSTKDSSVYCTDDCSATEMTNRKLHCTWHMSITLRKAWRIHINYLIQSPNWYMKFKFKLGDDGQIFVDDPLGTELDLIRKVCEYRLYYHPYCETHTITADEIKNGI